MNLKKFLSLPFYYWIAGISVILIVLFIAILQYPGYIYYWDLSLAFDFRNPLGQYFYTYSPYDGVEVGLKNRLPIVIVFAALFQILQPLFGWAAQDFIRIPTVFIFIGAFSAFYFVLPRFHALLTHKDPQDLYNTHLGSFIRMLLALLYVTIPFHTYRISQFHLFFFTTFYPLAIYFFISILDVKKFQLKYIVLLSLVLFFGMTMPHTIVYYLVTFIGLFVAKMLTNMTWSDRFTVVRNMMIAVFYVFITNFYWLIPYIMQGLPSPGYQVSQAMIDILSYKSYAVDFITDNSEWFLGQGDISVFGKGDAEALIVPQMSAVFLSLSAALYFIVTSKKKYITVSMGILCLFIFLFAVKESPLFAYAYDVLFYLPFGWIIREPNRIRIIYTFWIFLFFTLSIMDLSVSFRQKGKDIFIKVTTGIMIISAIVLMSIYHTPVFFRYLAFLKPQEIHKDLIDVNSLLGREKDYSKVCVFPFFDPYASPIIAKQFPIADATNADYLRYNLSLPPTKQSTVPVEKSIDEFVCQVLLTEQKSEDIRHFLAQYGIRYILVSKNIKPLLTDSEAYENAYTKPLLRKLSSESSFSLVTENTNFALYSVKLSEDVGLDLSWSPVMVAEDLAIANRLSASIDPGHDIIFYNYQRQDNAEIAIPVGSTFVRYKDNEFFYLDLLSSSQRKQYSLSPSNYTRDFGLYTTWGRASFKDKINGEIHNLLRFYGNDSLSFDVTDKVFFSDKFYENNSGVFTMKFSEKKECLSQCDLFIKVFYNTRGGELTTSINGVERKINLKATTNYLKWEKIGTLRSVAGGDVNVSLVAQKGFVAGTSILVIPSSSVKNLESSISTNVQVTPERDSSDPIELFQVDSNCLVNQFNYVPGFMSKIELDVTCKTPSRFGVRGYDGEFLFESKSGERFFTKNFFTDGSVSGTIYLYSFVDFMMWIFLGLSGLIYLILGIVSTVYYFRNRRDEDVPSPSTIRFVR